MKEENNEAQAVRQQVEAALAASRRAVDFLEQGPAMAYDDSQAPQEDQPNLALPQLSLFCLEEITYEEKAPRREAMENIIGTFRHMEGIHFVYLILGTPEGIHFYLGVASDLDCQQPTFQSIPDVGNEILQPALRGNFRGCQLKLISDNDQKRAILDALAQNTYGGILEGVPTIDEKRTKCIRTASTRATPGIRLRTGPTAARKVCRRTYPLRMAARLSAGRFREKARITAGPISWKWNRKRRRTG